MSKEEEKKKNKYTAEQLYSLYRSFAKILLNLKREAEKRQGDGDECEVCFELDLKVPDGTTKTVKLRTGKDVLQVVKELNLSKPEEIAKAEAWIKEDEELEKRREEEIAQVFDELEGNKNEYHH